MLISFHKNQLPSPCISVSSTTIELLEWLKDKTKVGLIKTKRNYDIKRHRDSYTYTLKYDDAIELLKEIEPYLVITSKKKRAQLILNEYKKLTPRNGSYSNEMLNLKTAFYENFIKIQ